MTIITSAGAYAGIDGDVYHREEICPAPSISSSGLKTLLYRSPAHYWWDSPMNPARPAEKEKPHFAVGKAAHDVLLLEDRWPDAYHVLPKDFNARATKEQAALHAERDAAREAGKTILRHDEAVMVTDMADSLRRNQAALASLTNGEPEMTLAWQDGETGVWLRARPDFLPHKRFAIPDLKTAADGSPAAFSRAIATFGYHLSAALYLDGIEAIYGERPAHFFFIVIEKEAPYVVSLYPLKAEDIQRGQGECRRAIRRFADCLHHDKWPGYSDEPFEIGLPAWARKTIDESEYLPPVNGEQIAA